MSTKQIIEIPKITLNWSEWTSWASIELLERAGGVAIPNGVSGVYEVNTPIKMDA